MAKDYWLDANVFIQAKNGPYGFDIAPGFWEIIEDFAQRGIIRSPMNVRAELIYHQKDDLSKWANKSSVKASGLFESSDHAVQIKVGEIAQFVQERYGAVKAKPFLNGADPWVIAHACVNKACVVTWESTVPPNSGQIKIPNIGKQFGVACKNTYDLIRALGVKFGRS